MAASLSRPCFISLHMPYRQGWAQDLVNTFRFQPVAVRETPRVRQLALRRGAAIFLVNERLAPGPTSTSSCDFLYDVDPQPTLGTASNVCFEVDDVPGLCKQLQSQGCSLPVPPTEVRDNGGSVIYGVASSIVGNISHTLLDRSHYRGPFLPGFQPIQGVPSAAGDGIDINHFDHITYVCQRGSARAALDWYQRCFGFHRFLLNPQERPAEGYVLGGQGVGMLLMALQSAQGAPSHGCKLVLAESLSEDGTNQVDTFLEQHGGPGIQHVGLHTTDIVSTTKALQQWGAQFFTPPATYYSHGGKAEEIQSAGQDPHKLSELGILLDTMIPRDKGWPATDVIETPSQEYLMQIFTHPIFSEETFFLELIDRRGALGFGEGNIRALWKAVQVYMDQQQQQ
ncbi:4-hydroxyphenylpyruvate dioxygenase-like protein [Calypte anna]|uniref:4-hydroxyphenylpyruvate dioxygenase-like protein n=1 Tax=Calypte anna TaxID=9244 RepID=UPI0011C3A9BC|nr:4-hydroxyphenylpyruvate dioxygenase-like protein [Calypte anna]XP_030310735.1 4-hydroxyphenylpyruvate dioxygenase-like protein [Calypte anna]XP_030310736.1 4-hydroxyphenylpyruvate dioxygenase-like protein [Calypte anna]